MGKRATGRESERQGRRDGIREVREIGGGTEEGTAGGGRGEEAPDVDEELDEEDDGKIIYCGYP